MTTTRTRTALDLIACLRTLAREQDGIKNFEATVSFDMTSRDVARHLSGYFAEELGTKAITTTDPDSGTEYFLIESPDLTAKVGWL